MRSPSLRVESFVALGVLGALTVGAAALGARAIRGSAQPWHRRARQPPSALSGPGRALLQGLGMLSAWRVWNRPAGPSRSWSLALWGVQLGLQAARPWRGSGPRHPRASLVERVALGASLAAYTAVARRVDRRTPWLMAPSLGWVSCAGLLKGESSRLHR